MKPSYILALAASFLASPALSQEYPGSFWVDPNTGEVQEIMFDNFGSTGRTYAVPQPSRQGWIQIGSTVQGRDRIEVNSSSRRVIQSGRNRGLVNFQARIVEARRSFAPVTRYSADCENFDLRIRGDRVPIEEGTVGEALYNWACPTQ